VLCVAVGVAEQVAKQTQKNKVGAPRELGSVFLLGGQCTIRINPEGATCDLGSLVDETRTGARLHVIDLDLRCTISIIMSFVRSA
jgi:hypothetical protein